MRTRTLWPVLVLSLCACPAVKPPVYKPRLTVVSASIAIADPTTTIGADPVAPLIIHLRVTADNRDTGPLRARAIDWQLAREGAAEPIARGRDALEAAIPARASATLEVRLAMTGRPAQALIHDLAAGQQYYRVSGTLHCEGARADLGVGFDDAVRLVLLGGSPDT